jgi:hypothetical protein
VGSLLLSVGGLVTACIGLALMFDLGVALAVAGTVCFVAGALSGREGRRA